MNNFLGLSPVATTSSGSAAAKSIKTKYIKMQSRLTRLSSGASGSKVFHSPFLHRRHITKTACTSCKSLGLDLVLRFREATRTEEKYKILICTPKHWSISTSVEKFVCTEVTNEQVISISQRNWNVDTRTQGR